MNIIPVPFILLQNIEIYSDKKVDADYKVRNCNLLLPDEQNKVLLKVFKFRKA